MNCSFYLKTGSCRFGERCGKHHPYPEKSSVILFKNMYVGLERYDVVGEDTDDALQVDEKEIQSHFEDFYNDVLSEFEDFGKVIQCKVRYRDS